MQLIFNVVHSEICNCCSRDRNSIQPDNCLNQSINQLQICIVLYAKIDSEVLR